MGGWHRNQGVFGGKEEVRKIPPRVFAHLPLGAASRVQKRETPPGVFAHL